jgi:DNA-binding PucR family transcriptional regulator
MIPAGGASTAQVQANLRQALAGAEPPLAAGIGRMCTGFDNYIDSYHEASACLAAARRRSAPGEVLSAADVGVLDWLTHKSGPGPYPDVVADTLGPLLQADEETGSEYVKTLDAFLSNDRHLDKTALALNVHPNTVRYRVGKAQERLGVDLHNVDARFMIELALRVHAARPPEDIQEH